MLVTKTYHFDPIDIALGMEPEGIVYVDTFEATYSVGRWGKAAGGGMLGMNHTEETKKKLSEIGKGRDMSKAVIASSKARKGKPALNKGAEYPQFRKKGKLIKDGVIYEVDGLMRFGEEHNVCYKHIGNVLNGKRKSHKGFRLWENH